MSLFATIESFFGRIGATAETALADVRAGFETADNLAGVVLGQAELVGPVVALVDPPLGAAITAGAAAVTTLRADLQAGLVAGEAAAVTLGKQVAQLLAGLGTLGAQVAPFYQVVARDAKAAVAAVKALPAIPATVA